MKKHEAIGPQGEVEEKEQFPEDSSDRRSGLEAEGTWHIGRQGAAPDESSEEPDTDDPSRRRETH